MRKFSSVILVATLLVFGACKRKDVEVSSVDRTKAAHLATEAQMQLKLHDNAEAEKLLSQAVELDPTVAAYWSGLGLSRVLKGDMSGAKKAYKKELELCEEAAKKSPKDIDQQLSQLRPLVMLGRADDARKILERVGREHPDHFKLQQLIASKPVDAMLANPKIQEAMIK